MQDYLDLEALRRTEFIEGMFCVNVQAVRGTPFILCTSLSRRANEVRVNVVASFRNPSDRSRISSDFPPRVAVCTGRTVDDFDIRTRFKAGNFATAKTWLFADYQSIILGADPYSITNTNTLRRCTRATGY